MTCAVNIKPLRCLLLVAGYLSTFHCHATEVAWRSFEGHISTLQVYPEDSFLDVISRLESQQEAPFQQSEFLIDFVTASVSEKSSSKSIERKYRSLSPEEKKDAAFIITTLGNGSLASIASSKSSLKKAGDRIESVHPLQLLELIFTSERLKAAMHNLRDRTLWIWSEFFNGLKRSLDEEAAKKNLNEHVTDFASNLDLDYSLLYPLIAGGKWKDLIDTLLTELPRKGETDRYDL